MPYQSWHSDKAVTQTNTERVRRIITVLLPFRKITERKEVAVFMQYKNLNMSKIYGEYCETINEMASEQVRENYKAYNRVLSNTL